ncbi:MAG TPA: hypothetical protein VN763_16245, partial [Saprospiraceae bacterium]|nr:hypothetical protein [Saprospiraceae bacterium]
MRIHRVRYIKCLTVLLVFLSILQAEKTFAQTYPPRPIVYGVNPFLPRIYGYDTTQNWSRVITIQPFISGFTITSFGGLAFDPCTYQTYATATFAGLGEISHLVKMDLTTGVCINVGSLGDNFASIQFDRNGNLYGVTDDAATDPEQFYAINKTNASKTLLTALGNGGTGEVIAYNRYDDLMFHFSGDNIVVYEKFSKSSPYTITGITSGPPGIEIYGALCLGPNKFIVIDYSSGFRYVDTLGNFSAPFGNEFELVRGLVMPPVFSTNKTTVCKDENFSIANAAANGYTITYDWGDGTPPAVIQPGTVVTHAYTTTGLKNIAITLSDSYCGSLLYTNIVVNVVTPIIANAGPDKATCGATPVTLEGNNISGASWTGGAGTFNPNRNAFNATYTPTVSEIGTVITLTWSAPGACASSTDNMTVTVSTPATANAGPDRIVCGTTTASLNATPSSGATWTGGLGAFNPNRNFANATYTPALSEVGTTVTLTWNVPDPDGPGPCNGVTDNMTVKANASYTANAGPDQTSCGTAPVTLAANTAPSGSWLGGIGAFFPSRNVPNAVFTPLPQEVGTTVTLTWVVADPDGPSEPCVGSSDQMNVTIVSNAAANAGPDQLFCGLQTATLAANTTAGGNWTGGLGTFNPNRASANAIYTPAPSESGTIVSLTWNIPDPDGGGACVATSDLMTITYGNGVSANAGPDQVVCGAQAVSLSANVITGGNWIGGAGTFSPNRNTANATYTPALGEVGSTVMLTWVVPDPDGSGSCTGASDQMGITLNTPVAANAGADVLVCGAVPIPLFANNASGGNWTGGAGTFSPNRNSFNATYTPAGSEIGNTITLIWNVSDPDGSGPCTAASDGMSITINNPVLANAGPDKSSCGNGSVILAATAASGGNWTGGAGTFNPGRNAYNAIYTPAVSEFGTTITLTWNLPDPDASGPCLSSNDAMTITVYNPAIANAGTDQAICGNVSVTLAANAGVGGNWTGGIGIFNSDRTVPNATYSPALSEIGTTVTLTWNLPDPDGAGPCSATTDAMTISFSSAVTANAGADQSICGGIPVTLNGNTVNGGNWTGGNGIF